MQRLLYQMVSIREVLHCYHFSSLEKKKSVFKRKSRGKKRKIISIHSKILCLNQDSHKSMPKILKCELRFEYCCLLSFWCSVSFVTLLLWSSVFALYCLYVTNKAAIQGTASKSGMMASLVTGGHLIVALPMNLRYCQ